MEKWQQAYKDYKKGMKYKEIAEKHDVSLSAVKSWASRYWKSEKVATKQQKKLQPSDEKLQPKSRGAPKGSKNAAGNGGGAPLGNKNALKHGGYSTAYWDTLDEEEKEMLEGMPEDEETMLLYQIRLCDVRERRLMQAINKYRNAKGGLAVSGVQTTYTKREFDDEAERILYDEIKQEKIKEKKISYLGYDKTTHTDTDATINIIQRLENELTRVQRQKTHCIATLNKLRQDGSKGNEVVDDWVLALLEGEGDE